MELGRDRVRDTEDPPHLSVYTLARLRTEDFSGDLSDNVTRLGPRSAVKARSDDG